MIPHHVEDGPANAPVLLIGSSLGTSSAMWDGQRALAGDFRLVRYDHRGHGGSAAPAPPYEIENLARDVLELMDVLAIERASHCGISIGAMVAMWLGANAPERVDRLVLACTSARLGPPQVWQDRAAAVLEAGSTEPIADSVVDRWLTPRFAAAHPEVRAQLRAMLLAADPVGYAACCGAIEQMDLRGDLPGIAAPALVISGSDDPATPLEHQQLIARAIPGARHEIVGPAAHIAAVEQPDAVTALIREHLA